MALTTVLTHEHEIVLEKLKNLEASLEGPDFPGAEEVLSFMETDLGLHRRKEEEILFPALGKHIGVEGGPIAVMLQEHATEKGYVTDLRTAVDGAKAGEDTTEALRKAAWGILDLLRAHIEKEDKILYPMAEKTLSSEEKADLAARMDEVGTCCKECDHS